MADRYSIASARDRLAQLIHDVEDGRAVEITRRGHPVAVVLSIREYHRLRDGSRSFLEAVERLRREHDFEQLSLEPEEWIPRRDPSPGRPVDL
jgi:prevent-host-death family protein